MHESMAKSTEAFIKEAVWLGPSDQAAISALQVMAADIDDPKRRSANLVSAWYKVYKDLRDRQPVATAPVEKDEQELFMTELGV